MRMASLHEHCKLRLAQQVREHAGRMDDSTTHMAKDASSHSRERAAIQTASLSERNAEGNAETLCAAPEAGHSTMRDAAHTCDDEHANGVAQFEAVRLPRGHDSSNPALCIAALQRAM